MDNIDNRGVNSYAGSAEDYPECQLSWSNEQGASQPQMFQNMLGVMPPAMQQSGTGMERFLSDNQNGTGRLFEMNSIGSNRPPTLPYTFNDNLLDVPRHDQFVAASTIDHSSVDPSTPRDWAYHSPAILASDPPEYARGFDSIPHFVSSQQGSQSYTTPTNDIDYLNLNDQSPIPPFAVINDLTIDTQTLPQLAEPISPPSTVTSNDERFLPCPFRFAGCPATFRAKNEWKRHTETIHLRLTTYICHHKGCQYGKKHIFNRRDLFTSHYKRMHFPPHIANMLANERLPPAYEDKLKIAQAEALKPRCDPPNYLLCPVKECAKEFRGGSALDDRMEHHAKHYEDVARGSMRPFAVGGHGDRSFTKWAESSQANVVRRTEDGQSWVLCNPPRAKGKKSNYDRRQRRYSRPMHVRIVDEDAEGEEQLVL